MYTIDADKLTIRDTITLQKSGGDIETVLPILRDIEDLPAKHLRLIVEAISKKLSDDRLGN